MPHRKPTDLEELVCAICNTHDVLIEVVKGNDRCPSVVECRREVCRTAIKAGYNQMDIAFVMGWSQPRVAYLLKGKNK